MENTPQIQSVMYSMCNMLFTEKYESFESIPNRYFSDRGFYVEYYGLHYYLIIKKLRFVMFDHDPKNREQNSYNCIRSNYKIDGLEMTPSNGLNDDMSFEISEIFSILVRKMKTFLNI